MAYNFKKSTDDNPTLAQSPADFLKFNILEARENFWLAVVDYQRFRYKKVTRDTSHIRSRLLKLFVEIRSSYLKAMGEEELKALQEKIKSESVDVLISVGYELDNYLYKKGLTVWDTKKDYDRSKTWEEDAAFNL